MGITIKKVTPRGGLLSEQFPRHQVYEGYLYVTLDFEAGPVLVRHILPYDRHPTPLTVAEEIFLIAKYDINYRVELVTVNKGKIVVVYDGIPGDAFKTLFHRRPHGMPVMARHGKIKWKPWKTMPKCLKDELEVARENFLLTKGKRRR